MEQVRFRCVKEGSRLRVKIISGGYNGRANCQFPKAIRVKGREFLAPRSAVTFSRGTRGTLWYKVKKSTITIIPTETSEDFQVYEVDDDPECCICMAEIKRLVFIPCGHFCVCSTCNDQIDNRCPICRADITDVVDIDEIYKINSPLFSCVIIYDETRTSHRY